MLRKLSITLAVALITTISATSVFGHEDREEGEYIFKVGFLDEPAYEGQRNAVSLRVTKMKAEEPSEGHGVTTQKDTAEESEHAHDGPATVPVEGLEATLQVDVTHVPSGASKVMNLRAAWNDPGHYLADLIPTSPGHYRFRFFGTIEGNEIDTTYDSRTGGGSFDDIREASAIHFPETVASGRELESTVRGAQAEAQQARNAAASAEDAVSSASMLGIIGIVVGAIGIILGGTSLLRSFTRSE